MGLVNPCDSRKVSWSKGADYANNSPRMKLYFPTTPDLWDDIQRDGLSEGTLVSERVFALLGQESGTLVVETDASAKFDCRGVLAERWLQCQQFELIAGETIAASELRLVPEEELIEDRQTILALSLPRVRKVTSS